MRTASSGAEGLKLARECAPDLITLDVIMPDMDGWAVLAELKDDAALRDVPVVMITQVEGEDLGLALGATSFLTKPVRYEAVQNLIQGILESDASAHVLVVEDEPDARELIRRTLARASHRCTEAENGRIAIIDWKKKDLPVGPPPHHKLARDTVVAEMKAAGFRLDQEPEILENQYFLIFKRAS